MPRNSPGMPASLLYMVGHCRDAAWHGISSLPLSRLAQTAALPDVECKQAHRLDEKAL